MSDSLRLAAVIPCYNHERYIGKALESILAQTRRADRIIVLDDGSKDGSVDAVRKFESRGVELIVQENAGAHNALNRLVEMAAADCEIISILNSDDYYAPERFEKCLLEFSSSPAVQVVSTELQVVGEENEVLPAEEPRARWFRAIWSMNQLADKDYAEWLGMGNFPATTSNILARREFFQAHPFRPYRFNHDYYFLAQAVLRGGFHLVAQELLYYRVHGSNTMNTAPAPLLKEMLRMHLDLYEDLGRELAEDSALRERFYRYMRSAWNNVSSLHAGMLQVLFAQKLADGRDSETLLADLDEEGFPELRVYPNKALVNTHDGESPLVLQEGLAEKYEEARQERARFREEMQAWRAMHALRQQLLESGWARLGMGLGLSRGVRQNEGKTAEEKLEKLEDAVERSGWLKLGGALGLWKRGESKGEGEGDAG